MMKTETNISEGCLKAMENSICSHCDPDMVSSINQYEKLIQFIISTIIYLRTNINLWLIVRELYILVLEVERILGDVFIEDADFDCQDLKKAGYLRCGF